MRSRHGSLVIAMLMNKLWSSNRGTTLVEILVVMVILLVGILTIVQLFPTGFSVVRAAESRTIAGKLAEGEIERWKNLSANLPAGILPIDQDGAVRSEWSPGPPFEAFVVDPSGGFTAPDGTHYRRGNALNIRQVVGETTAIPVGSYFQTGYGASYGARYTLAFGPIDVTWDSYTGLLDGLAVKSGDLTRITGQADFYPPYLKPGEYAIDYGQDGDPVFYVAFPKQTGTTVPVYYITYSYWVDTGSGLELRSVLNHAVDLTRGGEVTYYDGDWVPVDVLQGGSPPPGFLAVEPSSDSCARAFVEVTGGAWSPDDPYQFALADNILGVVSFNPVGHGMYEATAEGVKPIQASIDYRIYDPRIIREDKVVPQLPPGASHIPVKMALRFILDEGDPTDNPVELTYKGMAPAIGLTESVLLIDLATGMRVKMSGVEIDHIAGIVNLPQKANLMEWDVATGAPVDIDPPVDLPGRRLRFFYRADGDWSIQCSKAYSVYSRDYGQGDVDYRHYKVQNPTGGLPYRLLFAPCEAEKTVAVDYSYLGPDNIERKVVGESHQISEFTDASNTFHFVDLNVPESATLTRVYAVVGTSFKVRALWRDGTNWRHVDIVTSLVHASS